MEEALAIQAALALGARDAVTVLLLDAPPAGLFDRLAERWAVTRGSIDRAPVDARFDAVVTLDPGALGMAASLARRYVLVAARGLDEALALPGFEPILVDRYGPLCSSRVRAALGLRQPPPDGVLLLYRRLVT